MKPCLYAHSQVSTPKVLLTVTKQISDTKCECKGQVDTHTQGEVQQTSEYDTFHFIVLTKMYTMCTVCVSLASSKYSNICIQWYHNGSISVRHPLNKRQTLVTFYSQ